MEHHCPWGEGAIASGAAGGQREVLQWVREHGCPWDAMNVLIHRCLGPGTWRWRHCPLGEMTCESTAMSGHLEVFVVGAGAPLPVG